MERLNKLMVKYFIILIILLPLRRIGSAMMIMFGQKWMLDYFGSYEAYQAGHLSLIANIEAFNFYLFNIIIAIFVFIDLKAYRKLTGIPILTALIPVYGVSLFMIQQYYFENNKIK